MKKILTKKSPSHERLEIIRDSVLDSGKDVDEIKEDVDDISEVVDYIKISVSDSGRDVDEIKEDVDELIKKHDSLSKKLIFKLKPDKFAFDDIAQQIVGAMIVSSPLAVTEEVWKLSFALDPTRLILIFFITLIFDVLLIYFTKYQTVEKESVFKFIPIRLISLLVISYITAGIILFLFGVIGGQINSIEWVAKLILFVGLFANIGAGAADMLR